MRVSLLTETFRPEVNGVARTLAQLAHGLTERGHELEVVRPRQRHEQAAAAADDVSPWTSVTIRGLPLPGYDELRFGLPGPIGLWRRWRRLRPDVVHVATEGPLGLVGLLSARSLGIPVTSTYHTNFDQYGRFYGFGAIQTLATAYLRWFHNRTRVTLAPCGDAAGRLTDSGFDRVAVLGRGVDTDRFSPRWRRQGLRASWRAAPDQPVVAYVGRLAQEKNLRLLLRAFDAIRVIRPDTRFVLVGDGPAGAALRKERPDLLFSGMLRGEPLSQAYASADVMLFPSRTETFGNVVLEGMASGLAVVALDYAAAAEQIIDGENGRSVPFDDDQAFVDAACSVVERPERWRKMGAAAHQTADACSWARVVDRLVDSFDAATESTDATGNTVRAA